MKLAHIAIAISALSLIASSPSFATPLLLNGDFETGTFAGWTVVNQIGGSGSWFIDTPGTTTPRSGFATLATGGSPHGSFYAVTDQRDPGAHVLLQSFTVVPGSNVLLTFDMFANDQSSSGPIVNPAGLTYATGANQHARVDLLNGVATPFDTGAGVLANYFLGVDAGPNPHPFTHYSFDITSIVGAGGTFQLRFAEVDNQFYFQNGVDNVSIEATAIAVPEPLSLVTFGFGITILAFGRVRVRRTMARTA